MENRDRIATGHLVVPPGTGCGPKTPAAQQRPGRRRREPRHRRGRTLHLALIAERKRPADNSRTSNRLTCTMTALRCSMSSGAKNRDIWARLPSVHSQWEIRPLPRSRSSGRYRSPHRRVERPLPPRGHGAARRVRPGSARSASGAAGSSYCSSRSWRSRCVTIWLITDWARAMCAAASPMVSGQAAAGCSSTARGARQLACGPVPAMKRQVDGPEELGEPFGPGSFPGHATTVAAG